MSDRGSEWQAISTAPFDRDLELAVINYDGVHALVFPCRRILTGWLKSGTQEQVNVQPTHWREWEDARSDPALQERPRRTIRAQ